MDALGGDLHIYSLYSLFNTRCSWHSETVFMINDDWFAIIFPAAIYRLPPDRVGLYLQQSAVLHLAFSRLQQHG